MATTPFRDLTATDRIEATLAWSRATFPDAGVREVLIGREDLFADALAAGGIQASWFIPFLITHATTLDPRVRAELQRLAPGRVTILGGTDAVSGAVEADLNSMGYVVRRAAGPSRLETAVDAAQLFTPVPGRTGFGRYGIVVRAFGGPGGDESQAFADAIGMGSLPAARRDPVVLTQTDVLSTPSRTLLDHGDPTFGVRIVGGPAAVSGAVEAELGTFRNGVERIAGPTRFDTAIAALAVQGMNSAGDVDRVILVEGQAADAWAPGFAAIANASAGLRHAVVLANGPTLPAATQVWLGGVNPADRPELICAPLVDPVTCNAARGILGV